MTNCLFIGGTRDGEWHDVPINVTTWALPKCTPRPLIRDYEMSAKPDPVHKEYYVRQLWESQGTVRSVFYVAGMPESAVLDTILLGYMPRRLHDIYALAMAAP